MPSAAQRSAAYFFTGFWKYSMGISEISASPVRIFAAILPVVTPRS